jgi:peptidyl-prolyl cis-trans isomerase A (cyclophilin A)
MLFSAIAFVAFFAAAICLNLFYSSPLNAEPAPDKGRPIAIFDTTEGTFQAQIFTDLAPVTADNFISLAKKGFYDGTIFHRVIDGFMIQGGDPTGTGRGGSEEIIKDEFGPGLAHSAPGILSMANSGKNTATSQFFITLAATPWLDRKHAIFGEVIKGMEVVEAIGKVPTKPGDRPITDVKINKLEIIEPHSDNNEPASPPEEAE